MGGIADAMTTWLPWVVLPLVMLAMVRLFFSRNKSDETVAPAISDVKYRYRRRRMLCTADEVSFLHDLETAAGSGIRVFSKVHASHILIPRSDLSIDNWNLSFEKVVSKQFDYVLCAASDLTILCAVMLVTQKSIKNPSYRFILKACRSVDIPVINLSTEKEYSPSQIRYILKKHIPSAFPRARYHEVPSIIKEHQSKLSSSKHKVPSESLQTMLLREGRRRAERLEEKNQVQAKTN